jgi:hypothetical protein
MTTRSFATQAEATAALAPLLDQPVSPETVRLPGGLRWQTQPIALPGGTFTNLYRACWSRETRASLHLLEEPLTTASLAHRHGHTLTSSGGFFFLADRSRFRPKALCLNLALREGRVASLPCGTQEALICRDGVLEVLEVPARGELSLEGVRLRWVGAKMGEEADCVVYGNACCVIRHEPDPQTGLRRVLQESSRLTPELTDPGQVDLGFCALPDGDFCALARSETGGMDIFQHDLVLRCPRRWSLGARLSIHQVGPLRPGNERLSAMSVGPLLSCPDFQHHPRNADRSLGSVPLLVGRPSSRLLFFEARDGSQSLCLLDGRPGSPTFPGVTLEQAVALVHTLDEVERGCFLDSGHTASFALTRQGRTRCHGNRHYLRWPTEEDPRFLWSPEAGRPTASLVSVL